MKDPLSKLPFDIQHEIISYTNPYKEYFTREIINRIWKKVWMRYYKTLTKNESFVMSYILDCCDIFEEEDEKPKNSYKLSCIKTKEWKKIYPTDIRFEFGPYNNNALCVKIINKEKNTDIFQGIVISIKEYPILMNYIYVYDNQEKVLYMESNQQEYTGVHSYSYPY